MTDANTPSNYKGIPRIRRELTAYIAHLEATMNDLHMHRENPEGRVSGQAAIALACAHLDRSFPPVDNDRELEKLVEAALKRQLTKEVATAIMSVEDALAIAFSAREGVRVMDSLDEPVPERWSNLQPSQYAREINRLAHALCRGRVPGWQERQA